MGLGDNAVTVEKKTKKELKKERQEEIKQIIAEIRALMRQEQGTAADSSDWKEFETALAGFLSGDIKGNAATLSIKLLDNIKNFSKNKKSFIESAKGQQIAEKLHREMVKVPGALDDPQAAPLLTFLGHVAAGDGSGSNSGGKGKARPTKKEMKEALDKTGMSFIEKEYKTAPKDITVEEGKKEQEEAMEALRKLHKALGVKSPEEIKQEQIAGKGMV